MLFAHTIHTHTHKDDIICTSTKEICFNLKGHQHARAIIKRWVPYCTNYNNNASMFHTCTHTVLLTCCAAGQCSPTPRHPPNALFLLPWVLAPSGFVTIVRMQGSPTFRPPRHADMLYEVRTQQPRVELREEHVQDMLRTPMPVAREGRKGAR